MKSDRGAILIHVAIALLALTAFSAFVFDQGILYVSKRQAQNSADAAALSGAISLSFDNIPDPDAAKAAAKAQAQAIGHANAVWLEPPDIELSDITFPTCPPGAPGVPDTCVKVDVFRNQVRNNPLPTIFGSIVGVNEQGVRATATAQLATGDTTDCLRPWAVIDRWIEAAPASGPDQDPGPYNAMSTYDKYSDGKGNHPPQEDDLYIPPTAEDPGTGYTLPADEGRQFAVKVGAQGLDQVSSGWFRTIDLARTDTTSMGSSTVQKNILSCSGIDATIAKPGSTCPLDIPNNWDDTVYWETQGCFRVQTGAIVGDTRNTIHDLEDLDNKAHWVDGEGIVDSKFDPPTKSPRVVPIGVMDIDQYLKNNPTGSNGVARLVNIYGFFIEGMGDVDKDTGAMTLNDKNGQSVIGRLMTIPSTGKSTVTNSASFLRQVILVR